MGQQNVTIAFVNQPKVGKKNGSIKTKDGEMFGVPPEKLAMFQQGGQYQLEYSERQFNGQIYRTVVAAHLLAPPQASGGNKYSPVTDNDATAERIFVCGALNAHIQSGQAEMSLSHIGNVVNMLRQVWSETFGSPQKDDDMNGDSIPY